MQDAVVVCQSLGIRYLWVDALCIVQNDIDERDWYEQSGEMCEIFSNAHLVISADASPSSNFGFLPGRDHVEKQWQVVRVSDQDNNRQLIASVRVHKANTYVTFNGKAWDGTISDPLLHRGWALQESMLANRLLHITVHGPSWECNHIQKNQMSLMSRAIRVAKITRIYPGLKSNITANRFKTLYEDDVNSRHITEFF